MQSVSKPILQLVFLLLAQYLVAGGIISFLLLSRLHEDKAFPGKMKINIYPRLMHRERAHFILVLTVMEIMIVAVASLIMPGIPSRLFGHSSVILRFGPVVPVIAMILAMIAAAVAGAGAASKSPRSMAYVLSYLFAPLYMVIRPLSGLMLKLSAIVFPGLKHELSSPFFMFPVEDEHGEGFLEENGSILMHSIVEFGEKRVREVMVPRIDVFALDIQMDLEDIRDKVAEAGHSRVPIYENTIDRIVGMLYVKDLVARRPEDEGTDIRNYMREAYFVPESKKIDNLLREFQMSKRHIAVVVDEYGGTSGIVTLEDILEEIVGDIRDEYDHEAPLIRSSGPGAFIVEGRISLEELEEATGVSLQTEDVDTLGGFLYDLAGRVPDEGEEIGYQGVRFKINRLDGQRISEVLMEKTAAKGD